MLGALLNNPLEALIAIAALVFSLTLHEFCHALAADRLGDPTARMHGRLTLNPLAHLDPLGTLALLVAGFGWAKPVPFDPYNLANPRRDSALIALAGPASNFLIVIVLAILLKIGLNQVSFVSDILALVIETNLVLGIFNFVPIAPLDGSKILSAFLPPDLAIEYESFMRQFGFMILLALIFPWYNGQSPINFLIGPIIQFVSQVIL